MTRTSFIKLIKILATSIVVLLIIAFAVWRSLNYARGPHITIEQPTNGSEITTSYITIIGRVERSTNLLINDSAINIDEKGNFTDDIVIFPGVNIITVTARDQFGRSTEDQLTLVGKDRSIGTEKSNLSNTGATSEKSVGNNIASSTTP